MRTLLIDADIVAYKVATTSEKVFDFNGDGDLAVDVDEQKCRDDCDRIIGEYCTKLKAHKVIVCLSDPTRNFRKELDPTYKAARVVIRKPALLMLAKHYMASEYQSFIRPRLEADDIMGILATTDRFIEGEKIMVSEDKDMKTIPAKLYNPNHPKTGVIEISPLDADRFHLYQTITGDAVDGYPGCPGAGPKAAEDILFEDRENLWDYVLHEYCSRGYTEDDAILQARLACILRSTDFNFKEKKVRLWTPLWLS